MLIERYDDPDFIISKHVKALFDLLHMNKDNHVVLRKILDTVLKHMRALKALKRPIEHWDNLMLHIVATRLDQTTSREWETTIERGKIPSFKQLIAFLTQRCRALEASSRDQRSSASNISSEKSLQSKKITAHVATANSSCAYYHQETHNIYRCKEFLALQVEQRIKEAKARRICLNCLKSTTHQAKECSAGECRKCSKRHNTLLHFEQAAKGVSDTSSKPVESNSEEATKATSISCASVDQTQQVLLAIA